MIILMCYTYACAHMLMHEINFVWLINYYTYKS